MQFTKGQRKLLYQNPDNFSSKKFIFLSNKFQKNLKSYKILSFSLYTSPLKAKSHCDVYKSEIGVNIHRIVALHQWREWPRAQKARAAQSLKRALSKPWFVLWQYAAEVSDATKPATTTTIISRANYRHRSVVAPCCVVLLSACV